MSFHKRTWGSFDHHHYHLNRAAAPPPDDNDANDKQAAKEAAKEAAASAAASKSAAAAAAAAAAASKAAQDKAPANAQATTLPGQGIPVPHGLTDVPPPIPTPTAVSSPSAVLETATTPVTLSTSSVPRAVPTALTTSTSLPSSSPITVNQDSSTSPDVNISPKSNGLSGGAVGGIVTAVILLVAVVGAIAVRKLYMRKRAMKRNTWGAGLVPALENKRTTVYGGDPTVTFEPKLSAMSQTATTPMPPVSLPPPPSLSYSPSAPASLSPLVAPTTTVATSTNASAPSTPDTTTEFAVVVRTFVPTLPDELHISNGEHIRILNSFDDGWAFCANIRGEQGVVPLECLYRETGPPTQMQLQPESEFGYDANKAARRLSSLIPGTGVTY